MTIAIRVDGGVDDSYAEIFSVTNLVLAGNQWATLTGCEIPGTTDSTARIAINFGRTTGVLVEISLTLKELYIRHFQLWEDGRPATSNFVSQSTFLTESVSKSGGSVNVCSALLIALAVSMH